MTTPGPHAQTLRALVLAAVASGAATLAHAVGGGHLVSATGVVVAGLLLTGATLPFVRSHLTVPRSVALLAVLQVVAHVAHGLTALASGGAVHTAGAPAHVAHGIRPLGRIATDPTSHAASGGALADLLPSPTMLVAHVVAALVVGVLLTRGEQSWTRARTLLAPLTKAVCVLRHLVRRGVLAHVLPTLAGGTLDRTGPVAESAVPQDIWRSLTPVRRGPPSLLLT